MSSQSQYIAFDLGAESGRCVVGTLSDERLELSEVHRFTTPMVESMGHLWWDVLRIYQELLTGLEKAVANFGSDFQGMSVDTWGVDYALLDADGRILGYPYHYRDSRTDDMIEHAATILPKADIYQKTGIQFAQFNTLFQLLAEQQNTGNLLKVADLFLPLPNYLLYLLSGVKKAEYTIASTTQFTNPRTRQWSEEMLDIFNIPKAIMPDIVEPGTVIGSILPDIAEKTGISRDTPVIASASHDTAAAVASIPATEPDWAFLSSGTWSLMGLELDEPVINEKSLKYNFTNEGGVEKKIRYLKNIIGLWPLQECRRYWAEHGDEYDYSELEQMAKKNGPAGAWVDLATHRFLKPGDMPEKIISFLSETGQPHEKNPGWISRCVIESLAFTYRMTIKELEDVTEKPIRRLHAVGGGIQNTLLSQLTANAINRDTITGPAEGTAAGNIGVQALATGELGTIGNFRKIMSNSFQLHRFTPENPDYFEKHEHDYLSIVSRSEE